MRQRWGFQDVGFEFQNSTPNQVIFSFRCYCFFLFSMKCWAERSWGSVLKSSHEELKAWSVSWNSFREKDEVILVSRGKEINLTFLLTWKLVWKIYITQWRKEKKSRKERKKERENNGWMNKRKEERKKVRKKGRK